MSDDYKALVKGVRIAVKRRKDLEQADMERYGSQRYDVLNDDALLLADAVESLMAERDKYFKAATSMTVEIFELRANPAEVIEAGDGLNHAFPTDDNLQAWQEVTRDLR